MQYVLVPTNPRIGHIGGIHGPYDSKEEAAQAIIDLNFPVPEDVLIKPLHKTGKDIQQESINWNKIKDFFESIINCPVDLVVIIKNEITGKQMRTIIPYNHAIEFMNHVRTDYAKVTRIKNK